MAAASIAATLYVKKSVFSRKSAMMTITKQKITKICKKIIIFLFDISEFNVIMIFCKDLKFHDFKTFKNKKKSLGVNLFSPNP